MADVTCGSMKKINMINFKDRSLLLNERNELVFKSRLKVNLNYPDWGGSYSR